MKIKTADMIAVALMTALIVICSWIYIPVGGIPVTLQTFAIVCASCMLKGGKGLLAVLLYLLLAFSGLPVLSGFQGGAGAFLGPTGGYAIGFVFIPLAGIIAGRKKRKIIFNIAFHTAGLILCYAAGTLWYAFGYASGEKTQIITILSSCVFPFIIPDIIKIALACAVSEKAGDRLREYNRKGA